VHTLSVIRSIDDRLPQDGYTHMQLHAASYSCCLQSYGQFLNVHPGSHFWWLHWQHCGGLTGVCDIALCLNVTHFTKRMPIGLIWIRSDLAEVVVSQCFLGVE